MNEENKEHKEHSHGSDKTSHKHHSHHSEHHSNIPTILSLLFIALLAVLTYMTFTIDFEKMPEAPRISLTVVGADCVDCYDIIPALQTLQTEFIIKEITNVTMENSEEIVKKYGITRLPALIFKGDTESLDLPGLEQKEDAMIFTQTPAPYYDVAKKQVVGFVIMTTLTDSSCKSCFNISLIQDQMIGAGIIIKERKIIDISTKEGQDLIKKYNIENVPTLLFNEELLQYEQIAQIWTDFGSKEADGTLVLRKLNPPYKNVNTGEMEGLVELIYLVDSTCKDCFEPDAYNKLLKASFNLYVRNETIYDVSSKEGKALLKEYNITVVPTVIVSKEANTYPLFFESWKQVGTQEINGEFVFRQIGNLESYLSSIGEKFVYKNITK